MWGVKNYLHVARDLYDRAYQAVTPTDANDPPRYGQPTETVKDAFVTALRAYFTRATQVATQMTEIPTVRKYTERGATTDNYETVVRVIRKNPGLMERLPHVMVMAASSQDLPLAVGPRMAAIVQRPPRLDASTSGPYALADGDVLVLRTRGGNAGKPGPFGGAGSVRPSELVTIPFTAQWFTSISAATAAEMADVINAYGNGYNLRAVVTSGGALRVLTTGGCPNEIEVDTATSDSVLTALGWGRRGSVSSLAGTAPTMLLNSTGFLAADVGRYVVISGADTDRNNNRFPITSYTSATQIGYEATAGLAETPAAASWFIGLRDDSTNPARPPMRRFLRAAQISLRIDVLAEDENTRTEVADLVDTALNFFWERQYFALLGRSVLDDDTGTSTPGEHYTISIEPPVARSGESEIPRPEGDAENKIYVDGFDVRVAFVEAIDREAYVPGVTPFDPWVVRGDDVTLDDTLAQPGSVVAPEDPP